MKIPFLSKYLFFSDTLIATDYRPRERLILGGTNNSRQVKGFYIVLLILALSTGGYLLIANGGAEKGTFEYIVFFLVILAIFQSIRILFEDKNKLLTFLNFSREGIQYNLTDDPTQLKEIPLKQIQRLRFVRSGLPSETSVMRIFINFNEHPAFEFKIKADNTIPIEENYNPIAEIMGLGLFRTYCLFDDKTLYEYFTDQAFKVKDRISKRSFRMIRDTDMLSFYPVNNHEYFAQFNQKARQLKAKTNPFYTVELDFDQIKKVNRQIRKHRDRNNSAQEYLTTKIEVETINSKVETILKFSIELTDFVSDIIEYECFLELDMIVEEIEKFIA